MVLKMSKEEKPEPQEKVTVSHPMLPKKPDKPITYEYSGPVSSSAGQSEQIEALVKALVKAQEEMDAASKDSKNPFFKSNYADYNSVRAASYPALNKNGLCVVQTFDDSSHDTIKLITTLLHVSGQWIKGAITLPVSKKSDPQACGSAATYARRYGLAAITGIAQQDDDGNSATRRY
jgi:hypothetical protein